MEKDTLAQIFAAASAGTEMALSVLMGSLLGYMAGGLLSPTGSYIGLMVGAALGLVSGIYRLYRKYG